MTFREEIEKQLEPFVKPAPLEKTGIDFVTTEEMLVQRIMLIFEKLIDEKIKKLYLIDKKTETLVRQELEELKEELKK